MLHNHSCVGNTVVPNWTTYNAAQLFVCCGNLTPITGRLTITIIAHCCTNIHVLGKLNQLDHLYCCTLIYVLRKRCNQINHSWCSFLCWKSETFALSYLCSRNSTLNWPDYGDAYPIISSETYAQLNHSRCCNCNLIHFLGNPTLTHNLY